MTLAGRVYRWSLRLLPEPLRADFGDDMAQLFADQMSAAPGAMERGRLLCAALADVVRQAARGEPSTHPSGSRKSFSNFPNDFRHGLRLLRRYPATAIVAVATLALGIGANVAIFSVVDAVLVRALPYKDPGQLVMIRESRAREGVMNNTVSPADFIDWRKMSTSFSAMAAYAGDSMFLSGAGEPVQLTAAVVSPGFFQVLGVTPAMGRDFAPEEEQIGKHRVAVITYGLWQRQFGGDPNIVNRGVTLSGRAYIVVGVLPKSFAFTDAAIELYRPLALGTENPRSAHSLDVFARMKPGVTLSAAHKELEGIGLALERAYPDDNAGHGANVVAMQSELVAPVRSGLLVLAAGVGFVLLLAAVNVANLMLVRGAKRAREMSVRAALGADRWRLVSQSFAECLAVAIAGGALGIGLAALLIRALPLVLPEQLAVVQTGDLHLDLRVLAAASGLTLLTSFVFAVLPALQASRSDVVDAIKQGGRGAAVISRRTRIAIVISEVTLASLTLVGAGLIVRSFAAISSQPLGVEPKGRFVLELAAPAARYATPESRNSAMLELERKISAIPGVSSTGGIDMLPLAGEDGRRGVVIEGREPVRDAPTRMHPRVVTRTYFKAAGMTVLRGRPFSVDDRSDAPPVSVINETAAARFWPGQDAIGKRWRFNQDGAPWVSIVGIARDVRHWGLSQPVNPMVFQPIEQQPSGALTFVIETALSGTAISSAARDAVHAFDANLPVGNLRTFDAVVAESLRSARAITLLMSIFGGLALLLASIGIYGVMSQLVESRAQEIGVRTALGARPVHILAQFLAGCAWQTAAGVAAGTAIGAALIGATPLLFGVSARDPLTLAVVALTIFLASLAACLVPVVRALRIDPVAAIRE